MKFCCWVLIALGIVAAISCSAPQTSSTGYATILPKDLHADLDAGRKVMIVDLREPGLYNAGHIAGAVNIPFEQFPQRTNELQSDDRVVLVCHTGPMGDISARLLVEQGRSNVANVKGGMAAWEGALER